jgi:hypothetical protein
MYFMCSRFTTMITFIFSQPSPICVCLRSLCLFVHCSTWTSHASHLHHDDSERLSFFECSYHGPETTSEICDWLCKSISRYVGTMLNGADSQFSYFFCCHFVIFHPPCSCHGPEPMNDICDWLCPSISRYVGTMLNGTDSHLCCRLHSVTLFSPLYLQSGLFRVFCVSYLSPCLLPSLIIHIHRPPSCFLILVWVGGCWHCAGHGLLVAWLGFRSFICKCRRGVDNTIFWPYFWLISK